MMTNRERVSQIGLPVVWKQEMYRTRFENRPWERGIIVAIDGVFLTAQRADGTTVKGNWAVFTPRDLFDTQIEMDLIRGTTAWASDA